MRTKEVQAEAQRERENDVVELMAHANGIARKLFGEDRPHDDATLLYATHEIFDYLNGDLGDDEEAFAADLKRTIENAKVAYGTETPTPQMVFGLFERLPE